MSLNRLPAEGVTRLKVCRPTINILKKEPCVFWPQCPNNSMCPTLKVRTKSRFIHFKPSKTSLPGVPSILWLYLAPNFLNLTIKNSHRTTYESIWVGTLIFMLLFSLWYNCALIFFPSPSSLQTLHKLTVPHAPWNPWPLFHHLLLHAYMYVHMYS